MSLVGKIRSRALSIEPELRTRIKTGLLGAALLLSVAIFGGRPGLSLIAFVVALGSIAEFSKFAFQLPDRDEKRLALLGSTWLLHFAAYWMPRAEYELLVFSFLALFAYFLFTASRHEGEAFAKHFQELTGAFFGWLYLAFLPLFLPMLHSPQDGSRWAILALLVVWVTDSGAYFAGKRFGRVKLYPVISPKKTREGALGGLLCAVFVAALYKLLALPSLSWGGVFLIPLFVSPVSQVGDLCESFVKRVYAVKDSGSILPGHGGFMDRFDGVIFSLPVMYFCYRIFG
jgi:phosphatidate cytidylyltransferase